jgi:hypothetical protein
MAGKKAKKTRAPKVEIVKYARVSIIRGSTGLFALYINDIRIVGEKPWAGGTQETSWGIPEAELAKRLTEALKASR